MRVVCDTNVLISGIVFGGSPYEILYEASERKIVVVISAPILNEVQKVLRNKFNFSGEELAYLSRLGIFVEPQIKVDKIKNDPTDNKILECALEGRADYIITGDKKHLLPLKKFKNIPILSPQDFLKKVLYS